MTRHIQSPREHLYAEAVCGDPPTLTGGTWSRENADCARCIAIYDREHGGLESSDSKTGGSGNA